MFQDAKKESSIVWKLLVIIDDDRLKMLVARLENWVEDTFSRFNRLFVI